MRKTTVVPALALALFAAACGGREVAVESGPPARLDPVGTYDFVVTVGDADRSGEIHIHRQGDGYGGYATLEGEDEEATVRSVLVTGNRMSVELGAGEIIIFDMEFTGRQFVGHVHGGGESFALTGSKRAP